MIKAQKNKPQKAKTQKNPNKSKIKASKASESVQQKKNTIQQQNAQTNQKDLIQPRKHGLINT